MSEFEIQQLLIQSRWEFDVPSYLFVFVSLAFLALGLWWRRSLDVLTVRILQAAYLVSALFLMIRAYAAIVRGQKLGALLVELQPVFEFWNPALQNPTWYLRIALFLVLLSGTLLLLDRAIKR